MKSSYVFHHVVFDNMECATISAIAICSLAATVDRFSWWALVWFL